MTEENEKINKIISIIEKKFKEHDILFHFRFNFQDYTIDFDNSKISECVSKIAMEIIDLLKSK